MKKLIILILGIVIFVSCLTCKQPSTKTTTQLTKDSVNVASIEKFSDSAIRIEGIQDPPIKSLQVKKSTSKPKLRLLKIDNTKVTETSTNTGHVAYKIPSEMSLRNTYQVIVRISKSTVNIYENLNGEVRTSTIPITQTMEVKLIDPSPSDAKMFDMVADNSGVQIVDNNEEVTQWSWNVTPIKTGTSNLKIVISILRDGKTKETVYEDSVRVKMDMGKEIPYFFGKYWQWLISTLIIPFGVWLYKKRKGKNEETN